MSTHDEMCILEQARGASCTCGADEAERLRRAGRPLDSEEGEHTNPSVEKWKAHKHECGFDTKHTICQCVECGLEKPIGTLWPCARRRREGE